MPVIPSADSRPLDCFAYLTAPNSQLYCDVIDVFARARRDFRLNLRAAEVREDLAIHVGESEVAQALDQLCQWGNLESFSDQSQAATLEEFYKRHLYFQMSGAGVAALRAIDLFHELIETPASLQSTALSAVRDRLAELITLAKDRESSDASTFDVAKASSLLESLFTELENLTAQAQEFFRGLQATVELRDITVGAFMNFKERLVHYLQRFLNQVISVSSEAQRLLESVDKTVIDTLLDSVARHRTIDELDVNEDRIAAVRHGLETRWRGVAGWFAASPGFPSQADELRTLARGGIREVAAAAGRIHRARGGVMDRSADYQRLARWFAACENDAQAHRLWRSAFCLAPARHLTVSDATLAERDQHPVTATTRWSESPPLKIAPTLRKSGRVAKAGKTRQLVDNLAELAELREQSLREAQELAEARAELLTDGKRLSEFAEIGRSAFPLMLDLIGEALTRRGHSQDHVQAYSTDGSLRIELRPTEDDATCCLDTDHGTFQGSDFWVRIHLVDQ